MIQQRALTVIVPLTAVRISALEQLLADIGNDIENNPHVRFRDTPSTHFARWVIIDKQPEYGPWLYFSACYDGDFSAYVEELVINIGPKMEPIWGACTAESYVPGTCSDSLNFRKFLNAHLINPSIFLIAFPGLTLKAIQTNEQNRKIADNSLDEREGDTTAKRPPVDIKLATSTIKTVENPPLTFVDNLVNRLVGIDPKATNPNVTIATEPRLLAIEDKSNVVQNQMTVVSTVKPGLRAWLLIRLFLLIGKLTDKPTSRGNLSGLSTIHFARWVLINQGRQLLFESNYDGSWENYIDDFGDHAATGMNAVWGNCIGFPKGGSLDIESFKQVIRDHQFPTPVFYSAYPNLTVENIAADRNVQAPSFEAGVPISRS